MFGGWNLPSGSTGRSSQQQLEPEVHASMPFESILSMLDQSASQNSAPPRNQFTNTLLDAAASTRSIPPHAVQQQPQTDHHQTRNSSGDLNSTVDLLRQLYIARLNIELLKSCLANNAQQLPQPTQSQPVKREEPHDFSTFSNADIAGKLVSSYLMQQQQQQQRLDRDLHMHDQLTPQGGSPREARSCLSPNGTTSKVELRFPSNPISNNGTRNNTKPLAQRHHFPIDHQMLSGSFDPEDFSPRYQRNNKRGGQKNLKCFPKCSKEHRDRGFCGRSCVAKVKRLDSSINPSDIMCWAQFVCLEDRNQSGKGSSLHSGQSGPTCPEDIQVGDAFMLSDLVALERKRDSRFLPWVKGEIVLDGVSSFGDLDECCRHGTMRQDRFESSEDFGRIEKPSGGLTPNCSASSMASWATAAASVVSEYQTVKREKPCTESKDEVMFEFNRQKWGWHYSWVSNKYSCDSRHCLQVFVFVPSPENSSQLVCVDLFQSPPFILFCRRRRKFMQELTEADAKRAEKKRPINGEPTDEDEEGEDSDSSGAAPRKNKMVRRESGASDNSFEPSLSEH